MSIATQLHAGEPLRPVDRRIKDKQDKEKYVGKIFWLQTLIFGCDSSSYRINLKVTFLKLPVSHCYGKQANIYSSIWPLDTEAFFFYLHVQTTMRNSISCFHPMATGSHKEQKKFGKSFSQEKRMFKLIETVPAWLACLARLCFSVWVWPMVVTIF